LYFVPEFPRLTETFIEREISKLIERGNVDLTIFSLQKGNGATSDEVISRVIYKRLRLSDFPKLLAFVVFHWVRCMRLLSFSVKSGIGFWILFKSTGYAMFFSEFSPDHVHAHFLSEPSTVAMLAARLLDVQYSVSAHARDVFVDGEFIKQKAETAKFIAACNENAGGKVKELAADFAHKVHVIYHGIDSKQQYFGGESDKNSGRSFVFVGSRLVEKKGLKYVIEASNFLKAKGVNHEIHIVGPGPMYAELMDYARRLGVSDRVFISGGGGGLSHEEVKTYFKRAHVFLHPSVVTSEGDVDGVPTFVIEAALAKLPIVTTGVGSIADLIDDQTGILVPDKNSVAIADALEKLIDDPTLRKTLGEAAYEKARRLFDLDVNVAKLEEMFLV